jgi:hypothetical protein
VRPDFLETKAIDGEKYRLLAAANYGTVMSWTFSMQFE